MDFKKLAEAALEARERLVTEARSINDDTTLSDAEKRERIEKINADITAKTAEARSFIEQGEREAEVRSLADRAGALFAPGGTGEQRDKGDEAFDLDAALRGLTLGGEGLEVRSQGSLMNYGSETRAADANTAITTTSAWAGTTIQNTFVANIIESMLQYSPILQSGVKIITTGTGEKMEWPLRNGHIQAAQVAEGAAFPRSKGSFTRWSIDSFKYGVIAQATKEMLRDSQLPLAALIAEDIGLSLATATNADFLKGAGTTNPQGLVTGTTLNTTLANAAAITTDALVTFQHSITPPYRGNAKWYVSDDFVLKARLLKDGQGRYVWQDGIQAGAPSILLGKPVITDVLMDGTVGAGKVPVVYGDLSKFLVRFVGSVNVSRSDEYGWDSDLVSWKGSVSVDSGMTDAAATAKITMTA